MIGAPLTVFRQPVAIQIVHNVDRHTSLAHPPHDLLAQSVVEVLLLHHTVDREAIHPLRRIVRVAITLARATVVVCVFLDYRSLSAKLSD